MRPEPIRDARIAHTRRWPNLCASECDWKRTPTARTVARVRRRVSVVCGDGKEFLRDKVSQYDVIIIDSSDPVGPASEL